MNSPPGPVPLWAVQTRLLLTVFATFSGNRAMLPRALESMAFFTLVSHALISTSDQEAERDCVGVPNKKTCAVEWLEKRLTDRVDQLDP